MSVETDERDFFSELESLIYSYTKDTTGLVAKNIAHALGDAIWQEIQHRNEIEATQ